MKPEINIIAAIALNGVIGNKGRIPWHIPYDLKRFKELTLNCPVIMGKNTWMSLPKRPLPDRRNIVISSTLKNAEGADVYSSVQSAIDSCSSEDKIWIIGGERVYNEAMKIANNAYLTEVLLKPDGDAFFDKNLFKQHFRPKESSVIFTHNNISYAFSLWKRI